MAERSKNLAPFLVSLALLAGIFAAATGRAKEACEKKKSPCVSAAGKVTDCCTTSQVCKSGKCFYPGELQKLEEKKAKSQAPAESSAPAAPPDAATTTTATATTATTTTANKEDNTERIKMLAQLFEKSTDFKVRVQAIFSLGKIKDAKVLPYLKKALGDKHPAVRAAAATCLGNTLDKSLKPLLAKLLAKDPNPMVKDAAKAAIAKLEADLEKAPEPENLPELVCEVPYAKVKYLFVVGSMTNKTGSKRQDLTQVYKKHLSTQLQDIEGAMIVLGDAVPDEIVKRVQGGKTAGFIFNATLQQLDGAWDGGGEYVVTASVSIYCSNYPSQSLALTMQASATSSIAKSGYREKLKPRLEDSAINGTFISMVSSLKKNLPKLAAK